MIYKVFIFLFLTISFILLTLLAVVADKMHTDEFNKCAAAGGVYLSREWKCIKATEIKV